MTQMMAFLFRLPTAPGNGSRAGKAPFGFSVLVLALVLPMAACADEPDKKLHVQIGEYDYAIPQAYLSPPFHKNCNQSALTLDMQLPDFTPRNRDLREWKNIMHDVSYGLIGVSPSSGKKMLHIAFETAKRVSQFDYVQLPQNYFGLNVYVPAITEENQHIITNKRLSANYLFTYQDNDALKTFASCRLYGTAPNPTCSHYTAYNNALVKFSYAIHHLHDWKKNQIKLLALLNSWTIGKAKKILPKCCESFDCVIKKGRE